MKRNFTLIELIIVIVILGIISGIGAFWGGALIRGLPYNFYHKELVQEADFALKKLEQVIRRMKDNKSIYSASATHLEFIDKDNNLIKFYWENNTLFESVNNNLGIISPHIKNIEFTYYDDNEIKLSNLRLYPYVTNIRCVGVYLNLNNTYSEMPVSTRIYLYNVDHIRDLFK